MRKIAKVVSGIPLVGDDQIRAHNTGFEGGQPGGLHPAYERVHLAGGVIGSEVLMGQFPKQRDVWACLSLDLIVEADLIGRGLPDQDELQNLCP